MTDASPIEELDHSLTDGDWIILKNVLARIHKYRNFRRMTLDDVLPIEELDEPLTDEDRCILEKVLTRVQEHKSLISFTADEWAKLASGQPAESSDGFIHQFPGPVYSG